MRATCLALLATLSSVANAAPIKIAVLPTTVDATAKGQVPAILDDLVLTAVQSSGDFKVIGRDDINAILGFEKQKELLSCTDTACMADIAGALGADKLVDIKVGLVGKEWVANAKLINLKTNEVERRSSKFVEGDANALAKSTPVLIAELFGQKAPAPTTAPPAPTSVSNDCVKAWLSIAGKLEPTGDGCTMVATAGNDGRDYDVGWFEYQQEPGPSYEMNVRMRRMTGDGDHPMEFYFLGGSFGFNGSSYYWWEHNGQRFSGWQSSGALGIGELLVTVRQRGRQLEAFVNGARIGNYTMANDTPEKRVSIFFKGKKGIGSKIMFRDFSIKPL